MAKKTKKPKAKRAVKPVAKAKKPARPKRKVAPKKKAKAAPKAKVKVIAKARRKPAAKPKAAQRPKAKVKAPRKPATDPFAPKAGVVDDTFEQPQADAGAGTGGDAPAADDGPPVGIDVSHHQGEIDWAEVAATAKFAFVKATDGLGSDATFKDHWQAMKDAKVLRGAYHFFRPLRDPVAQADHFCDVVGALGEGDLPPVVDVEQAPVPGDTSVDQWDSVDGTDARVDLVVKFVDRVKERLGRAPILYTGRAFWRDKLANSDRFADLPLWIANYTTAAAPNLPAAWSDWTFWQHSEKGAIEGIAGAVDLDRFNGTLDDLKQLAKS